MGNYSSSNFVSNVDVSNDANNGTGGQNDNGGDAGGVNNNDNSADGGENTIEEDESNVDHDRLTSLSNYYDNNDSLTDDQHMVSFMDLQDDPERYEGTGINLSWGEYYVPAAETNGDEDESGFDKDEAKEISKEQLDREDVQRIFSNINNAKNGVKSGIKFDSMLLETDAESNLSLLGMPDTVLECVLHYTIDEPSEMCVLERVCKRIHMMTASDDFWARRASTIVPKPFLVSKGHMFILSCELDERDATTREMALKMDGIRRIGRFQRSAANVIIDVLKEEDECLASTLRTLSANILTRMTCGPAVNFRLRGDTIGYLCELVQGFMVERLEITNYLNTHYKNLHFKKQPPNDAENPETPEVQREDIALAFKQGDSFECFRSLCNRKPMRCNLDTHYHGELTSYLDCSCSLRSAGIIWRWPHDNCHGVLPAEAGRRIIRRLAYIAGIVKMSNEAFILAEAELLHAFGTLLVDAYESSVEVNSLSSFLDTDVELTYNEPTGGVDMFRTPPPPFYDYNKEKVSYTIETPGQVVYTIVPGQISAAAKDRGITPSTVYGDMWIVSSGFTQEEEIEIERSYYYSDVMNESDDDTYYDDDEKEKSSITKDDDEELSDNDSKVSWMEREEDEDSEMDLDDYCQQHYEDEFGTGHLIVDHSTPGAPTFSLP